MAAMAKLSTVTERNETTGEEISPRRRSWQEVLQGRGSDLLVPAPEREGVGGKAVCSDISAREQKRGRKGRKGRGYGRRGPG